MKKGDSRRKFGHQLGRLNMPTNAPADSWWLRSQFYDQAKAELPRMLQSKIHHQIVALRIVGHLGSE